MKTINICPADNESEEEWLQSAVLSMRQLIKNRLGKKIQAWAIPALLTGQSVPIRRQSPHPHPNTRTQNLYPSNLTLRLQQLSSDQDVQ